MLFRFAFALVSMAALLVHPYDAVSQDSPWEKFKVFVVVKVMLKTPSGRFWIGKSAWCPSLIPEVRFVPVSAVPFFLPPDLLVNAQSWPISAADNGRPRP